MKALHVFSGEVDEGPVGTPVGADAVDGQELHTGDIVMVWHGEYVDTDLEQWSPSGGLTAVVTAEDGMPFVMGIKGCGFNHPEWQIHLVKKFSDVIPGEHWKAYGFNYREVA